ncbi:MAG: (d)CMP kinase [Pseudomonadota bacterium]|nr:(d)CMP kinase [Pseudomonadota bacterium]
MKSFINYKPVIAIDGTAGSGKGTLAKSLSRKLKFDHLDTGLLYRIYAYEHIKKKDIRKISVNLKKWFGEKRNLKKLRTEEISELASNISQRKYVRDSLVTVQRDFANNPPKGKGSVIDGRDIGTIIVPKAEVKFFIDANIEIRALRRMNQLNLNPKEFAKVLNQIIKRDSQDKSRSLSPLTKSQDSFFIDTSNFNEKEVLDVAIEHIRKKTDFI